MKNCKLALSALAVALALAGCSKEAPQTGKKEGAAPSLLTTRVAIDQPVR